MTIGITRRLFSENKMQNTNDSYLRHIVIFANVNLSYYFKYLWRFNFSLLNYANTSYEVLLQNLKFIQTHLFFYFNKIKKKIFYYRHIICRSNKIVLKPLYSHFLNKGVVERNFNYSRWIAFNEFHFLWTFK